LKRLGGIPIDRSKGVSVIKQIIQEMNNRETMHLAITPEGTRKYTKRWKAGFHTIAKATGATVYLGLFDFGRKEIGWVTEFEITDDPEADIRRMKAFYREYGLVARNPELFTAED
jgi:1-acyl-sn-glycerol-3-phosphate acyltransferase